MPTFRRANGALTTGPSFQRPQTLTSLGLEGSMLDAAFFASANPGHELGHDLVCLAELSPAKLRPAHRARLLGTS